MKCPNCNAKLVMADRQGIEIDYCPDCRGVWLDRGELDKIIERSTASMAPPAAGPGRRSDDSDEYDRRHMSGGYPKKKKATSLLGEIFDF